jgi:hypothetical protein
MQIGNNCFFNFETIGKNRIPFLGDIKVATLYILNSHVEDKKNQFGDVQRSTV